MTRQRTVGGRGCQAPKGRGAAGRAAPRTRAEGAGPLPGAALGGTWQVPPRGLPTSGSARWQVRRGRRRHEVPPIGGGLLDCAAVARKLLLLYLLMALGAAALQVAFGGEVSGLFVRPASGVAHDPAVDVGWGVGLGLATVLATRLTSARFAWARAVDAEFREMLAPIEARDVPGLAVMSALAEEMFFRGFLQPHVGLTVASVAFGLAHLPHRREQVPWTLAAVVMGFAFGGLFAARGSLLGPFLAHFTINYFNLFHLLRPRAPEDA